MSDKLLDILKEHPELTEQELMDYLAGHLTPQERHEIEAGMADNELMTDAAEGLGMIESKEKLNQISAQLNRQLSAQLKQKRLRPNKWHKPNMSLLILTTFILLVLIVMAFILISKLQHG
jgi:anti-sigma factor RsiW